MANFSVPRESTSAILLTLTVVNRPRSLRCTLKLLSASHTRKIVQGVCSASAILTHGARLMFITLWLIVL